MSASRGATHVRALVSFFSVAIVSGCASVDIDRQIARSNQDAVAFTNAQLSLAQTDEQRDVFQRTASQLLEKPLSQADAALIMGDTGGSMGEMEMPLPDNTLPMMTGAGPYGGMEMGGMFTVVKVREGLARNDNKDPGWYQQPAGTQAFEWTGPLAAPERFKTEGAPVIPSAGKPMIMEMNVRKPSCHSGH